MSQVIRELERLAKRVREAYADLGMRASDVSDLALGRRDRLTPPARLQNVGGFLLTDRPAPAPYFDFSERVGVASAVSRENPEAAIAYPESWLRDRLAAHDLALRDLVHYGSWRGISSLCYQDIVVATGA